MKNNFGNSLTTKLFDEFAELIATVDEALKPVIAGAAGREQDDIALRRLFDGPFKCVIKVGADCDWQFGIPDCNIILKCARGLPQQ